MDPIINIDDERYALVAIEVVATRWLELHDELHDPELAEGTFADAALARVLKLWIRRRNLGEIPKAKNELLTTQFESAHLWLEIYKKGPRTPQGEIAAAALTQWMVHAQKEKA